VCCGAARTNENTGMLSIDTLILFSMLMILLKLCCSWSYFVGMQADILEKIICEVELSLQATGSFPESSVVEPPSTLMWTLFLLAQVEHTSPSLQCPLFDVFLSQHEGQGC
jgi:hypothetical protein